MRHRVVQLVDLSDNGTCTVTTWGVNEEEFVGLRDRFVDDYGDPDVDSLYDHDAIEAVISAGAPLVTTFSEVSE